MFELIVSSLYLILPVYFANMCPVLLGKMKFPFGVVINAKWFGKNKTWRGIYSGVLGALLILAGQRYLQEQGIAEGYRLLNYLSINIWLYAFLMGVGAIIGDLVESFVKRRLGMPSGKPFFPFDQVDFVLGSYLFLLPVYILDWNVLFVLILVTPLLHFLTNVIAYFLRLKEVWW